MGATCNYSLGSFSVYISREELTRLLGGETMVLDITIKGLLLSPAAVSLVVNQEGLDALREAVRIEKEVMDEMKRKVLETNPNYRNTKRRRGK